MFLGVDGGATGCRARIVSVSGYSLGEGKAGPANPRFGLERAQRSVLEAIGGALLEAGLERDTLSRLHAGLGLAGTGQKREREAVLAWRHPFATMTLATDAYTACLGAHGGGDGAIMIVGTGSCGCALVGGRETRVGGWGFPISDQGSGAALGLELLRHTLLAYDGVEPKGPLSAAALARFDDDPERIVAWLEEARTRDYAALAPIVVDAAAAEDPKAVALMREAAGDLASMLDTLLATGAERLCLMGGLAEAMTPWLPERLRGRLSAPMGDALDGAVLMARRTAEEQS